MIPYIGNLIWVPKEMNDLAENYPEVVDKLENLMEKAHTKAALEKFNIPILD